MKMIQEHASLSGLIILMKIQLLNTVTSLWDGTYFSF